MKSVHQTAPALRWSAAQSPQPPVLSGSAECEGTVYDVISCWEKKRDGSIVHNIFIFYIRTGEKLIKNAENMSVKCIFKKLEMVFETQKIFPYIVLALHLNTVLFVMYY